MKELIKRHLPGVLNIIKLRGEASHRRFYRVFLDSGTVIAMVYPQGAEEEIRTVFKMTRLYEEFGIAVPRILEMPNPRMIILEDLGDLSLQRQYGRGKSENRDRSLTQVADLLVRITSIPPARLEKTLDHNRMKAEMDFFLSHFVGDRAISGGSRSRLESELGYLVEKISKHFVSAHRDFHSRNMQVFAGRIYLVDFQDSLAAPVYYDLVSFAFDSYLDLKNRRTDLFEILDRSGLPIDYDQLYLTALQRNIKALGTFGFQIHRKKNLVYKKYIPRTLNHILGNPMGQRQIPAVLMFLKSI